MNVLPHWCFRKMFPEKLDTEGFLKKTVLESNEVELEACIDRVLRGFGTIIIQVDYKEM